MMDNETKIDGADLREQNALVLALIDAQVECEARAELIDATDAHQGIQAACVRAMAHGLALAAEQALDDLEAMQARMVAQQYEDA